MSIKISQNVLQAVSREVHQLGTDTDPWLPATD